MRAALRVSTLIPRRFLAGAKTTTTAENCIIQPNSNVALPITTKFHIHDTQTDAKIPVFRMLDPSGKLLTEKADPQVNEELAQKMYQYMVRINCLDDVLYNAQRQGRISFYMQANGEEAIHIGCASALDAKDLVFAQYREQGVLLWRGFSVQQACDQCFSNEADLGKGRQMPVHYGSNELNFQTVSSPLTTQLPQAVGAAYAFKRRVGSGAAEKQQNLPICFFGEGAASEGDFHAALNFAATLEAPMLFFCRNNGYAISTPTSDQYRGDGIASRAAGYGMYVIRVDGNDLLAVRKVVQEARALAIEKQRPVLIEAMTYRQGHHSTSDDSTRYRSLDEINRFQEMYDPSARWRKYMESQGWWNEEQEKTLREKERSAVLTALSIAEKRPKPHVNEMFDDVYHTKPAHLVKQEQELHAHVEKYPEHYLSEGH